MIFSFISLGGQVDECIASGRGPQMFTIQGKKIYHLMGCLKPAPGAFPKFSQMYIVDNENEVENRASVIRYFNNSVHNNIVII